MKRPEHNARLAHEHVAGQAEEGGGFAPLRRLFLFRTWKDDDLKPLAQRGRFTTHHEGEILFRAGEECDRLLVLVEGQIEMFRDQQGRRVPLHTVRGQALIACAALFLDQCFPASAMVVSPAAEVFQFPGKEFLALLEKRPELARRMISALAQRLSELADRLEAEHALSAVARLARWLGDQPSTVGRDGTRHVTLNMTKRSLAETLGMKPETLSRALRQLIDQQVIRQTDGGFIIADPGRLVELSGS